VSNRFRVTMELHGYCLPSHLVWSVCFSIACPRLQATMELLFFASIGDASRCETICELWDIDVRDRGCCDYDKRTPL